MLQRQQQLHIYELYIYTWNYFHAELSALHYSTADVSALFQKAIYFYISKRKSFVCCILLDSVGKSTVAENFGKNGKSIRRKDFIRISAGRTRKDSDGSACFLPKPDVRLTMVSTEEKAPIFSQIH